MAVGAVHRCSGRNMRILTDIWENQEAEIEQNMDQNCKLWDLLPIDPFLPAWPHAPRDSTTSRSSLIRASGDTSHLDQTEVPLNCEL